MCFYIARGNYLLKVNMGISNFLPEKDLANGVVLVSIVTFELILYVILMFLLLTLNK